MSTKQAGLLSIVLFLAGCAQQALYITNCPRTADMPAALKSDYYRSATPSCVPNGRTIDIPGLLSLIETQQPILIDVLPIIRRADEGFGSTWLQKEDHQSLPNTTWLANVGYAHIEAEVQHYLQKNLEQLTSGDKNKPLVFFCIADCWMSWNTVQRVRSYGYTQVYWFKEGTDGWREAGRPLKLIHPQPLSELDKEMSEIRN